MKRAIVGLALAAAATAGLASPVAAQLITRQAIPYTPAWYPKEFPVQNAPRIPFKADINYFDLPLPEHFGEIVAVTTNSKGHVFILSRGNVRGNLMGGSATQVFEFNEHGGFVRELGRNIYSFGYGHGIRTDADDNIWVVDKGTNMVTKFDDKTGKVLMVLGRRPELSEHYWQDMERPDPNAEPPIGRFGEPTDIAFDSQGNIYVSDGYIHSRVAKFDKNGKWLGYWGRRGTGPGEFWTAHNIAIDSQDRVWVADRSNGRLQVFDTNGKFIREVIVHVPTPTSQPQMNHQFPPPANVLANGRGNTNLAYRPGAPDALCIPKDGSNTIFVGDIYPGLVYKLDLNGKVLGWFGSGVGKLPGETGATHGLACPNQNLIYTAEFQNWRVQRFDLNPGQTTAAAATPASR